MADIQIEASLFSKSTKNFGDWVRNLLDALPLEHRVRYFSGSERLRKHPDFDVSNKIAFDKYVGTRPWHWFHGESFKISTCDTTAGTREVHFSCSKREVGMHIITAWIPSIANTLYYAYAAAPQEVEHRNGYQIIVTDTRVTGHGWVGRDLRRYIPGLFWINFVSHEYAALHAVNISLLPCRTGGTLTEFTNGTLLQLYDTPGSWVDHCGHVDSTLGEFPGFFSRKRAGIAHVIETSDELKLISQLGREWP